MLYKITDGSVSLGGETVLSHIDFHVKGKEKIAIVGRNGAGKTTLLRLLAGELTLDRDDRRQGSGRGDGIWWARNTTIGMLHQQAFSDASRTVTEEMYSIFPGNMSDPADIYSKERYDFEQEFDRIFTGFGFSRSDKEKKINEFSGGEQTKIAFAKLLLQKPDILLLDEPTNHLDFSTVFWLENYLKHYEKAVVLVSHDRYFIDQVAESVWEIEDHRMTHYAGNYTAYYTEKKRLLTARKKRYEQQKAEEQKLEDLNRRFRHHPNKAKMARTKKRQLENMRKNPDYISAPPKEAGYTFHHPIVPSHVGSKTVYEMKDLQIGYREMLHKISLRVRRGQKIGIIGDNGSGKTTLLRTLAGEIPSLGGEFRTGEKTEAVYFDQHVADILRDTDMTSSVPVQDARNISEKQHTKNQDASHITEKQKSPGILEDFIQTFPGLTEKDARLTLSHYLFAGRDCSKTFADLSGGERSRYVLAKMIESGPNVMLLDEPTNHMDIPSRENLESAFCAYKGTILFASHDRYFIQHVATSLLIIEQDRILYYPDDYDHYVALQEKKKRHQPYGRDVADTENALLVESFNAVPEKTRMQSARFSTDQAFTDWQLELATKQLHQMQVQIEEFLEKREEILAEQLQGLLPFDNSLSEWKSEYEKMMEQYSLICKEWADKFFDYEESFRNYRE